MSCFREYLLALSSLLRMLPYRYEGRGWCFVMSHGGAKLAVIVFALCGLVSYAHAGGGVFEVGAKGSVSWEKHSSNSDTSKNVYKRGGSVGCSLRVSVSDWIAVQPEVLYATRGSDVFWLNGAYFYSSKQDYLQVPILARVRFLVQGRMTGYVVAGPAASYLLSAEVENDDGPLDLGGDSYRSFDVGLIGGVGAAWELVPHWSVVLEARYDAGMMDIFVDSGSVDLELRNRAILLTLGVERTLNDADRDGVPNHADRCQNEAEDRDGFEDQDGCLDVDVDGDGMLDEADACPNEAEDTDGFEDQDGCADVDNDGDGILDVDDRCPSEAFPRNDGCLPRYEHVEIAESRLALTPGIRFTQGKWDVTEVHEDILDDVAQALADYPDMRLRIEGHADTEGDKRTNDEISELRAREVFLYLTIEKKIDRDRLEVEGHGMREPISYEKTREGKQMNRRVVLAIIAGP